MGLLDDAIREHLDLKRRRGADPGEVARAEREALGPVRRAPAEDAEAGADGETALVYDHPDDDPAYDQEDQPGWDEPLEEEPEAGAASPEFEHGPPASERPTRMYDAPEPASAGSRLAPDTPPDEAPGLSSLEPDEHDDPFVAEYERDQFTVPDSDGPFAEDDREPRPPRTATPAPHPAPASPAPPRAPSEHVGQETAEYHVEGAVDEEGEDVLEETPEFLQDTPDHDRLWFEQRPPRDFDFEG